MSSSSDIRKQFVSVTLGTWSLWLENAFLICVPTHLPMLASSALYMMSCKLLGMSVTMPMAWLVYILSAGGAGTGKGGPSMAPFSPALPVSVQGRKLCNSSVISSSFTTLAWNEWCFRPWYCSVRLCWTRDNLGKWDESWYETCHRFRVHRSTTWSVAQHVTIVPRLLHFLDHHEAKTALRVRGL